MTKPTYNSLRIFIALVAVVCFLIFPPWSIVWAWVQPLHNTVQEQVDAAIEHGLDGIIIYIDQAGQEPEIYAAGWKDRENKILLDPDDLFRIASISKLYIAAAVVKLVEDDSLSLERTLAEYLPELENRIEYAGQVTLRMMIQHRSGIPNFTDSPNLDWGKTYENPDDHLQLVLDEPATFKPDSKYGYSNTNYLLLAKIMDRILGYSHHIFIKKELLTPLNLQNTFYWFKEVDNPDRLANGYVSGYNGNDVKELDHITPGGNMVATAEDVGIFLRAMIDGDAFTKTEREIYTSVYPYNHTGLVPGYQSWASYSPELDAVVVQFVNTSGGFSWEISNILHGRIFKILEKR